MGDRMQKRGLSVFDIEAEQRKNTGKSSANRGKAKPAGGVSAAQKSSVGVVKGTKTTAAASNGRMNTQKKASVQENPLARRNAVAIDAPAASRRVAPRPSANRRVQQSANRAARQGANRSDPGRRQAAARRPMPSGAPKRRAHRRKKGGMSFMGVLMLLMILGCIGVGAWRVSEYRELQMMKAVVSGQTFYAGTYVDGVDVSSMTLEDALNYWEGQIEAPKRKTAVTLNDGTTITAEQMGYTSDYAQVLSGAWNAGRTGSLVERYERITRQMQGRRDFSVSRTMYNEDTIVAYVNMVGDQVDSAPVDAKLQSFSLENRSFEFVAEQVGYTLDRRQLAVDIANGISSGGASVNLQIATVAPSITLANVRSQYGMIAQAVTNASSSSSNRLNNIKVSLAAINGTCLKDGESFSFNEVVGKRTTERGYKTATAYSGGTVTEEVGGGICQVSTTLFNAAVKADLTIKERHPHSLTVSYVDVGKDAAVDWGNKDLKFTNQSGDDIYIICYLNSEKRVVVEIYGKKLPNGMSITLEGKKTDTVDYETQYELNFSLTPGTSKVRQKGKSGIKAVAYKFWWDANGNEIKREQLCKSTYRATPEIIEYCP